MNRRPLIAIALIAPQLGLPGQALAQDGRRRLFDVPLSRPVASLLVDVEKTFAQAVREVHLSENDLRYSTSRVDGDGAPVIAIHPVRGRFQEVIFHELWHLKRRAQGYPTLEWTPQAGQSVRSVGAVVHESIRRHGIYREARKTGVDPGKVSEEGTAKVIRGPTYVKDMSSADDRLVAMTVFKSRLELSSLSLQTDALAPLAAHQQGLALGAKMVRIVTDANPTTPKAEIDVVISCLNTLFAGQYRFEEGAWNSRAVGSITQNSVAILVSSVK